MWESKEQKERFYKQMYGGFNPDEKMRLSAHQMELMENMRRDFESSNPCLEIPMGLVKSYNSVIFSEPVLPFDAYPANYQLLLL